MLLIRDLGQNVYPFRNTREFKNFRSKDTLVHTTLELVVSFLRD